MRGRSFFLLIAVAVALLGMTGLTRAQTIGMCQNNCAQVGIGSGTARVGGTTAVGLTFQQGPDDGKAGGGIDEIAALALTIKLAGDAGGTPLTLADCTLNASGLPNSVVPDASISNLNVVVENASCTQTRPHCLCPDPGSGITPDNFINLVVYGPNPVPTPGPNPVDIPPLPTGPQQLLTINLKANAGANGPIPLHVYNQAVDSSHPQFTAFLSVGDKLAVDQTCSPLAVPGTTPPCNAGGSVSQVAITDGSVNAKLCVGDCDTSGVVTVDELLTMVNIALGSADSGLCPAGDANGDHVITIDEILAAVTDALTACPS